MDGRNYNNNIIIIIIGIVQQDKRPLTCRFYLSCLVGYLLCSRRRRRCCVLLYSIGFVLWFKYTQKYDDRYNIFSLVGDRSLLIEVGTYI